MGKGRAAPSRRRAAKWSRFDSNEENNQVAWQTGQAGGPESPNDSMQRGLWLRKGLHEQGYNSHDTCAICGEGPETQSHMFWQCRGCTTGWLAGQSKDKRVSGVED